MIMDFSKLKQKALELKNKTVEMKDKAVEFSAEKISQSWLVLKEQSDLESLIWKSENKIITSKEWDEKTFVKRSILVVWNGEKDFFKDFLISIPVLVTKSFSQSLSIKILDINNKNVSIAEYNIDDFPALVVFENKEVYKVITWEDNVKKVVKSLNLDINKTIEEI